MTLSGQGSRDFSSARLFVVSAALRSRPRRKQPGPRSAMSSGSAAPRRTSCSTNRASGSTWLTKTPTGEYLRLHQQCHRKLDHGGDPACGRRHVSGRSVPVRVQQRKLERQRDRSEHVDRDADGEPARDSGRRGSRRRRPRADHGVGHEQHHLDHIAVYSSINRRHPDSS